MDLPIDGQRIREARKAANMDTRQLASAVGVTTSCISNWERGASGINRKHWALLNRFLRLEGEPETNGQGHDLVALEMVPMASPEPEPTFLRLLVPADLMESLRRAATAEYRSPDNQALWAIRMTLEAEGYLGDKGREE